jgi:hypothetical protein
MSTDVAADDDLISLEEAAKLIPGADAGTLRRHARAGRLTVYRSDKAYVTTRSDVKRLIRACPVSPRASGPGVREAQLSGKHIEAASAGSVKGSSPILIEDVALVLLEDIIKQKRGFPIPVGLVPRQRCQRVMKIRQAVMP